MLIWCHDQQFMCHFIWAKCDILLFLNNYQLYLTSLWVNIFSQYLHHVHIPVRSYNNMVQYNKIIAFRAATTKLHHRSYLNSLEQGSRWTKLFTCPTSRIMHYLDVLIGYKRKKKCSNSLAHLVILLAPGRWIMGYVKPWKDRLYIYIDGLVQEKCNTIANALELWLSATNILILSFPNENACNLIYPYCLGLLHWQWEMIAMGCSI